VLGTRLLSLAGETSQNVDVEANACVLGPPWGLLFGRVRAGKARRVVHLVGTRQDSSS
jgi:hypothetical protein